MPVIRVRIDAAFLEPPPRSKAQIGPRCIFVQPEGYNPEIDWCVVLLPCHTVWTNNTPDKVMARVFELYPEAAERDKRPVSVARLADELAGIQVYYAHKNWAPVYKDALEKMNHPASSFGPVFEVNVDGIAADAAAAAKDTQATPEPTKRIIIP